MKPSFTFVKKCLEKMNDNDREIYGKLYNEIQFTNKPSIGITHAEIWMECVSKKFWEEELKIFNTLSISCIIDNASLVKLSRTCGKINFMPHDSPNPIID